MRLDKFIKDIGGASALFDNTLTYPAPYDTMGVMIASKAVRDFGGLKVMSYIESSTTSDLKQLIYEEITLNDYFISALNKMLGALSIDAEDPDKVERRTYGEDVNTEEYGQAVNTTQLGARSSTDTLGATDGTTTDTDTSYASSVGKQTTTSRTQTNQVTNGHSSTASIDTMTAGAHTDTKRHCQHIDTIEHFNNVGEDDAPDYIAKWLAVKNAPVLISFEKIIIDALTMPYYEEE